MKLHLASISPRPGTGPAQQLLKHGLARIAPFLSVEAPRHRSEAAFLASLEKHRARTAPALVLLDPRGKELSSEQLAVLLNTHKQSATQLLLFAVGPPPRGAAPPPATHTRVRQSNTHQTTPIEFTGRTPIE